MVLMQEVYYSGDTERQTFAYKHQPQELYDTLIKSFPWVNQEEYFAISEPSYHEILEEEVITCYLLKMASNILIGPHASLTARKFCMNSKTSFLRSYELYEQEVPSWLPVSAKILFYTVNHEELFRPFNPKASTFTDFYFGGNPEIIEQAFNLENKQGKNATWYGATIVNNEVKRVKQYCYDQKTTLSEWDLWYMAHCRNIGKLELI